MVNNISKNRNLDIIETISGIVKKRYPVYEVDGLYIYTPAIQNNNSSANEGVDIEYVNMEKILDAAHKPVIIVRYFNSFIVINEEILRNFINASTREAQDKSRWSFKFKEAGNKKLVTLTKSDYTYLVDVLSKGEFIKLMENEYGLNFAIPEGFYEIPCEKIYSYISSKGFLYSEENIKNLYISLRSKPFVILSGISGTGKTKIVELFAEAVGANQGNGRFKLIPVRPDWSDSSDLIGYKDINNQFVRGPLTDVIIEASKNLDQPYFVVLDEMNLARVEYYLSDFLSVIESRDWKEDGTIKTASIVEFVDEHGEHQKYGLPENLYIIGTVNMDETTHPFSKKVLDRANSIEFNEVHLTSFRMLAEPFEEAKSIQVSNDLFKSEYLFLRDVYTGREELVRAISEQLESINEKLKTIYAQVGYRVRDEIVFYMAYNEEFKLLQRDEAMDFCIMQKILPRLTGSGDEMREVLIQLYNDFTNENINENTSFKDYKFPDKVLQYPRSAKKVHEMLTRLSLQGFVSYWNV